jgi:hypothetical protein
VVEQSYRAGLEVAAGVVEIMKAEGVLDVWLRIA